MQSRCHVIALWRDGFLLDRSDENEEDEKISEENCLSRTDDGTVDDGTGDEGEEADDDDDQPHRQGLILRPHRSAVQKKE